MKTTTPAYQDGYQAFVDQQRGQFSRREAFDRIHRYGYAGQNEFAKGFFAAEDEVAAAEQAYGGALGAGKTRTFLASRLPPAAMAAIDASVAAYEAEDVEEERFCSPLSIREMIAEWRKGCSRSMHDEEGRYIPMHQRPGLCECCTVALIEAIERKEIANKGGAQ